MCAAPTGYHSRILTTLAGHVLKKTTHPMMAKCCVSALSVAYRKWSPGHLDRLDKNISAVIRAGVAAKDPSVREEARHLFWAYSANFAEKGRKIMEGFDASTRRAMERCEKEVEEKWRELEAEARGRAPPVAAAASATVTTQPQQSKTKHAQQNKTKHTQPNRTRPDPTPTGAAAAAAQQQPTPAASSAQHHPPAKGPRRVQSKVRVLRRVALYGISMQTYRLFCSIT